MSNRDREFYRDAGELLGLLIGKAGFGYLSMCEHVDGVAIDWSFNAKGQEYRSRRVVTFRELFQINISIDQFAEEIANGWKSDHRRVDVESEVKRSAGRD